MGLFDRFKKQDCEICGKEVGMFGYKKLEDGEICKDCVKLLSPWFEDRRHATVAQIKEQLAYRTQNKEDLKSFNITRTIGDFEKIHIEEVNGVPTRFFVTQYGETMESNPDIISFQDVVSCVTDVDVRDEEMKQRNSEGQMVSYNPPRYKHHHNFIIRMQIRNNPWFDDIHFTVNSGVVTLETVGGVGGGLGGAALSGLLQGMGASTMGMQANSFTNSREQRRYNEYRMMCEKIQQAVEDGKRGGQSAAQTAGGDPIQMLIQQIRNAPDMETVNRLMQTVTMMTMNLPNKDAIQSQMVSAMTQAQIRIAQEVAGISAPTPVQETAKPKFCPNCGAPYEGGKFCQSCGSKL